MRRMFLVVFASAAVLVPAALATTPAQAPSAYCKTNATTLIGADKTYKNTGECVSKQAALANANKANAAKACKAEMADTTFPTTHDNKTFDQFYGTNAGNGNGNGKGNSNAYGNCVSQKASGKTATQQNAQVNAAKKCKSAPLKDQIGAAPKTYRNFGACVSAQTKLT